MAKERKLKRKLSPAKEQAKIERLLGEEFDSLAQARRALKKESIPAKKPATKAKPKTDFKFGKNAKPKPETVIERRKRIADAIKNKDIENIPRDQKHKLVAKLGKKEYIKRLRRWFRDHSDEDASENPYCYHSKE